jgi:ferredoxin
MTPMLRRAAKKALKRLRNEPASRPAAVTRPAAVAVMPEATSAPLIVPAPVPTEDAPREGAAVLTPSAEEAPALTGIAAAVANAAIGKGPERERPAVSFTSSGGSSVSGRMNDEAGDDQPIAMGTAEDGTQYWGALDNESSRAKALGQTLTIDQWECINCGTCVENTDAVFVLPDDCNAVAYRQDGPMDLIQDAIDACPVTCIHWVKDPNEYEQLNDEHGNSLV